MEHPIEIGGKVAKGSYDLFRGMVVGSVLSAVGLAVTARLLPALEFGQYAIVFIIVGLVGLFRDCGLNFAVVRGVSARGVGSVRMNPKDIIGASVILEVALGSLCALLVFTLSEFIAGEILGRPNLGFLIRISSISVLANGIVIIVRSTFTGMERMDLNATVLVVQSALQAILTPALILAGMGVAGAVLGSTAASCITSGVGLAVLSIQVKRDYPIGLDFKRASVKSLLGLAGPLLKYGFPLSIATVASGFLQHFYGLLIAFYNSDDILGNYQAAIYLATLVTFVAVPITTMLFPMFSKISVQEHAMPLQTAFSKSVRFSALVVVPITSITLVVSHPLTGVLLGRDYEYAGSFLAMIVVTYLLAAFGSLSIGSMLKGFGHTLEYLHVQIVSLLIGVILGILLVPEMGVLGLAITMFLSNLGCLSVGLWYMKAKYAVRIPMFESLLLVAVSLGAAVTTALIPAFFSVPAILLVIVQSGCFVVIFAIFSLLLGVITEEDTRLLRRLVSHIGVIGRIASAVLDLTDRLARLVRFRIVRKQ